VAANEQDALDALTPLFAQKGMPAPVMDARLGRVAQALNTRRAQDQSREACEVSDAVVEQALTWAGVYERPACNRCFWTRKKTAAVVPQEILLSMADCLAGPGEPLLGVATYTTEERTFVTVTGARRQVVVDPVSRLPPLNTPFMVTGLAPREGGALLALLALPGAPVTATRVPLNGQGGFELQVPPMHGGGVVHISAINALDAEVARLHLDGRAPVVATAFPIPRENNVPPPWQSLNRLRSLVLRARTSRGLAAPMPAATLDSAAQDEANAASANASWPSQPLAEKRVTQVSEVGPSWRAFKFMGTGADDLAMQVESNPVILWALTRPVDTRVGLGFANLSTDRAHPMAAAVLVITAGTPGALDVLTDAP
jgi:hypothetical protein